jgi:capsular polysaccharide biosynthesis protein
MEMCRFSSILGAFIIGMEYQQFFLLVLKKLLCTRLLEIVQNTCLQTPDWFFECCWTGH